MHKLIKKHQVGGNLISPSYNWGLGSGQSGGLSTIPDIGNVTSWYQKQLGQSDLLKSKNNALGIYSSKSTFGGAPSFNMSTSDIGNLANSALNAGLNAFGKQADNISGGEQVFSKGTDLAFNAALKTGNPYAIGAAAVLKGVDYLNRFAGTTAKKQGTIGLDTGGYNFQLNTQAGKKNTLFGTIGGKTKRANMLTAYDDKQNLAAGNATYTNKQNIQAAQNFGQDVSSKNQQSLFGGLNTNILAAKNGTKINPSELRNLVKKAQRGLKLQKFEEKIEVFEQGGKMNVIPEGALHARKHNLPDDIAEQVTDKGIPVVTYEEGGELNQQAEIEHSELIFNKSVTDKLEALHKQFNETDSKEEQNKIALECGKLLTTEILENTQDNTNLIDTIK